MAEAQAQGGLNEARMQQNFQRHKVARRLLFPYTGEDALNGQQMLRIMLVWAVIIPLPMALCAAVVATLAALSSQHLILLVLIAFFSGAFIFGSLGALIIAMNNKSAQIRQTRQAAEVTKTYGGTNGS